MSRFTRWRARQKAKNYLESIQKIGEVKKVCSDNPISTLRNKGNISYERVTMYVGPSASKEIVRNAIIEHKKHGGKKK